jgi:H/ACA ribonucleoprotein complex subunit 3
VDVYLKRKRLRLTPQQAIGKGGEADVFALDQQHALKVFKAPTHPDYAGQPHEQQQAAARLAEHQAKLPAFPTHLPERVVRPEALATDRQGRTILGYSMRLLHGATVLMRYAERSFRQAGVGPETVVAIFRDLHHTLTTLHQARIVIGDFNDLNVLVLGTEAHFIDADSFQFGRFLCHVFTARFVDPLLCAPHGTSLVLQQPHNAASDWYAFTVMLMQCLLFVGPYGGLYKPTDPAQRVPHEARPLRRITIFHPEVQYPKPALPYDTLPDALLQYWHEVFCHDVRQPFPLALLDLLRWQRCGQCGTEHARAVCPRCTPGIPVATVTPQVHTSGTAKTQHLFHTAGLIVHAAMQDGTLAWLYHEQETLRREDGTAVLHGALDPYLTYQLCGPATVLGKAGQVITLVDGREPERLSVDSMGTRPLYAANARARYWVAQGQLLRDGPWEPLYLGDVLAAQTHFWVGPRFGFGLYRAGELSVAFTFDAERRGLNDSVRLPPLRGQWLDAICVFTETHCWFLVAMQVQGQRLHQCILLNAQGTVEAAAEATQHDDSWLGTLPGKCAAGPWLFAPTDAGIVRVEAQHGQLVQTRLFAETEPFVDSACHLFAGQQGMYIVDRQNVTLLTLS